MIHLNQINLKNIFAFIQGNIRYHIYYKYTFLKFLIPKHVLKQIQYRLIVMNKECYQKGECVICGCKTTALQFANKECDRPCYPPITSKSNFDKFLSLSPIIIDKHEYLLKQTQINKSNYVRLKLFKDKILVHNTILPAHIKELLNKSI